MSKRTRGRPVHRRPGTRPTSARPAGTRSALPEPRPLDTVDEAIAAADSATHVTSRRALVTAGATAVPPARTTHHRARAKPGSVLAQRAATEYVYVAQDLRRIALVAATLIGILLLLWIVLVVMGVSPLY
ncbi:MAG: hypothetical protein M3432_06485 [Chloroflexota bacterium]|nr:hypothetical protein [Chloroflexota bacterium]